MGIIETVFSIYFVMLLIRAVIPDTGQMTFNQPYRLVVKLTDPAIANLAKIMPRQRRAWTPVLGMLLLMIVQGAIYAGGKNVQARIFDCGLIPWVFSPERKFWGVGKSFIVYLVLIYRLYALLFLIYLVSPLSHSSDQISRLIKGMFRPWERFSRARIVAPVIGIVGFSLLLTVIWKLYQGLGWLRAEGMIPVKAGLNSIALLIQLLSVIIFLIVFRAVISWFDSSGRYGGPLSWLKVFTDPFIRPFRHLNLVIGRFDLTPLVAIFVLYLVRSLSLRILISCYPQ
jgi:uncharacterized protein YggT (Ycf19 family)